MHGPICTLCTLLGIPILVSDSTTILGRPVIGSVVLTRCRKIPPLGPTSLEEPKRSMTGAAQPSPPTTCAGSAVPMPRASMNEHTALTLLARPRESHR